MNAGSGLASGTHGAAELAEQAVRQALDAASLTRAGTVVLFLTREFRRQAQPALLAAARASGTLQIFGMTTSGVFTEHGWRIDQPAAAALVVDDAPLLADTPRLSLSHHNLLPFAWQQGAARYGLLDNDAATWGHGRPGQSDGVECQLPGRCQASVSAGLRVLGSRQGELRMRGYELCSIAGHPAVDHLRRNLPAEYREKLPTHQIVALVTPGQPGIPILSANADGSLTLAERLDDAASLQWAIRQPLAAEDDMRESLALLDRELPPPDYGLMLSCIGRGPLFYGDDDRDLLAFRERFPGTPLLGAYGSGQIAPVAGGNRQFHNSVMTLIYRDPHV